jgi:hypothetical protein
MDKKALDPLPITIDNRLANVAQQLIPLARLRKKRGGHRLISFKFTAQAVRYREL